MRRLAKALLACVLTGSMSQDCTIELTCKDNSKQEAGFVFQRRDGSSDFAYILPLAGIDQCHYTDIIMNDPGNRTYTWRVFAYSNNGTRSAPSNEATYTTPPIGSTKKKK
jgi:hypothetical protein